MSLGGCGEEAETVRQDVEATAGEVTEGVEGVAENIIQQAGYTLTILQLSTESCEDTHGRGHLYVGGDMGGQAVSNDPVFFLHHANVDRMWAMWQDDNRKSAETAVDYGNPEYPDDWRGSIFNFSEVRADEMFDFRALGYTYDTNEE